jgi:hypothetical protein
MTDTPPWVLERGCALKKTRPASGKSYRRLVVSGRRKLIRRHTLTKIVILFAVCLCVVACAADHGLDAKCAKQRPPGSQLPWGYYPGYGCGPLTPSQIIFGARRTFRWNG